MFLLVSGRHIGAHMDGHQHGVRIQISINYLKGVTLKTSNIVLKVALFIRSSVRKIMIIYSSVYKVYLQ